MEELRFKSVCLAWIFTLVLQLTAGQRCYICGPTEENKRCQPNKPMNVPSNITIDDTMCTVIENTAYHLDVLCTDYPGPKGYYFECVDKSNSQFSCRSTCGPSLNSIGTGPEFDLLNTGGGNLLLGKKNKDSLFDFSNFRNGGALDFKFGGVQQGRYNPNNQGAYNNANFTGSNVNGTFGSGASSGNVNTGGFSSNTGNANIFDKNLFGNSGLNNNVFNNKNGNSNGKNNNFNGNNLNGAVSNKLNNNNQNGFQFKNPLGSSNDFNNNNNNNLNPNRPSSFRDPFGGRDKKPTPKLNTPKGNPFGNAPAFGQAPFGPSSFGNPAPISNGKTGLGFLKPQQVPVSGPPSGRQPNRGNRDESEPIDFSGLGSSTPIDISKGAEQTSQSQSQSSSGNTRPESRGSFEGQGFPSGNSQNSPNRPRIEPAAAAVNFPPRKSDSGTNNGGVGGVGRQDPSALTFDVKPVVTNYPANEDRGFSPEQAKALYPIDRTDNARGSTSNLDRASGPERESDNEAKFNASPDFGAPRDFNENYGPPRGYNGDDYSSEKNPQQGKPDTYRRYDDAPNQPRTSGVPTPYDSTPKAPSGPITIDTAGASNRRPESNSDRQIYSPEGPPPNLNSYPGAERANTPPARYYNNPAGTSTRPDSSRVTSGANPNTYNRNNNYENPQGYGDNQEAYPSGNLQNNPEFGKPPSNNLGSGRSTNDALRSNEVRDAIGPEGLKTKGIAPPNGLDGSRLRGNKEPVVQGAEFVGTSLLADGDYLDRSNPGRAAEKQVPEEFEKPFEAQTSLFPGFDKFASGDGNSNFGTKDSVFNMFGDRGKSPPGFRDGNFNFNNPEFLRPNNYNNPDNAGKGKSDSGNEANSGRPNGPPQAPENQYRPNNNYDTTNTPNNNNNNNDNYNTPYRADRAGNQRNSPLQNRFGQTPSSQPIFQAADRVLGKGGDDNNNNNNNGLARTNPSYPPYAPTGSNNPYTSNVNSQGPAPNSPYFGNPRSSGKAPGQPAPYGNPYGNIPANQNPGNSYAAPYPSSGNPQPAVGPYGRAVGVSPYSNQPPQRQPASYPPYSSPTRPGTAPNPYLGGRQPAPPQSQPPSGASRYELPPASQLFYGNNAGQGNNPYAVQQPSRGGPPAGNQPSLYASYPGQNTQTPGSSPYNTNGYAPTPTANQPYRGQGQQSGFTNPSYQTPNRPGPNGDAYGRNNQFNSSPQNTVVNFRPLGPPKGSASQAPQSNPYVTGGGSSASPGAQQGNRAQQPGLYKNSQADIPSTVPAFTNIFGNLNSASNPPPPPPQQQGGQRRPNPPQTPRQSSSPFSFLTQELPNAAEKTAAFDLDNRKAFENRRQKFNTFDEGQPGSNRLRLPERRPEFIPGNPDGGRFPGGAMQQPGRYPGNPQRDQFTRGQGPSPGPGGDARNGIAPPTFNRFDRGGAGSGFQQPAPGLSVAGRGYEDGEGANNYRANQPGDPRLYGSFDGGTPARGGPDRGAPPLERGQPIRQPGGYEPPGDRFENPYEDGGPTNQRFDSGPRDQIGQGPPQRNDPFNRSGGYGFEEDKFGNLDDDAFRNRFSNDRFSDPTGYFGDSQFTDATTQEDTSQTSRQSDQGYDDVSRPEQDQPQYYPDY